MPYRPQITNAGNPREFPHTYRLGGPTCLAGDFIGEYSFKNPLTPGKKIIFEDMAIYSMVKNTTFNGINLPAIAIRRTDGTLQVTRRFGYDDFKSRL
jgi:carboxynorspermidine decarboxylase